MKLLAPKFLPFSDTGGFSISQDTHLGQEQVDRAVVSLQAFIASAPEDDQAVYATSLAQAQGFADDNWPAD